MALFTAKPKVKDEKQIAAKIKQRRLQLLVHSYIYYRLNDNIVSDYDWGRWAKELVELQNKYPEISKQVIHHDIFIDFDGSTGFNLYCDSHIINKAHQLLERKYKK